MKGILGVDPGLSGALAIRGEGTSLLVETMPVIAGQVDLPALCRWISAHKDSIRIAFLEVVQGRPGFAVKSLMTASRNGGMIEGVLVALGIPYERVPAQVWTREMHVGLGKDMKAKDKSALVAGRIFPFMDFRENPESKKIHDGLIDAALIAEYGRRRVGSTK
jgi:hypothetical protein